MAIATDLEPGTERRRSCRRSISEFNLLTADVLPVGASAERQQPCIVLNVSECGLAVQPFLRLFPGSLVELRFAIPGAGKPFESKGMVAWTGSGGPVGIQLIDLTSEVRKSLRKWVGDDLRLTAAQPNANDACIAGLAAQELASALHLIAKRAQLVTRANGAAIALGDAESMVCRASAGVAPDLGVSLRSGFGLAGECLYTGRLVQTADARSDPRIDPAVARQLQLGSAVIMPICAPGKLVGVLAVFSRHPRAFDSFHIRRLERLAAVIASALQIPPLEPAPAESKPKISASEQWLRERRAESARFARSDRPEESRLVSSLLAPKPLAAPAEGRPLHRLESLWNLIESAHYRRRSSSPMQ
jgi:putative methionine-R-sulfoxide reductase with GAF domain